MKKIPLLFSACLFQIAFAQNVFKAQKEIYLAQYFDKQNDQKESLKHYQKAFELSSKVSSGDYLKASSIAFALNKNEIAKNLLIESITKQDAPLDYIKGFEELTPFKNKKEYTNVLANYKSFSDDYIRNLKHPQAYLEIIELVAKDQIIRENSEIFNKLETKIDDENIKRFIEIIKDTAYEQRGWLLLWHQRTTFGKQNNVWDFFIPYFKDQLAKDNIDKNILVDFEEFESSFQSSINKTLPKGILYTMMSIGNLGQTEYFDIVNLDKRRKTVGLPPLYFDHLMYNVPLPEDYKYNKENLLKDLENL